MHGLKKLSPKQRLKMLNKQFSKLDINDFLRKYSTRIDDCEIHEPSKSELNNIFNDMGKSKDCDRHIDCSCCGYNCCTDMPRAIFNNFNHKENCIYYIKIKLKKKIP